MSTELSLKSKFGRKLRYLRRTKDFTQVKLSERIVCSVEYISRMERGLVSPSFNTIEKICSALEIEPNELFDFTNPISKKEPIE